MSENAEECVAGEQFDLKKIVDLRGDVYAFFSRGISREIDKNYLEWLRNFLPLLDEIGKQNSDGLYLAGVKGLRDFVDNIGDEDELIEEYARKFTSLFLNVSPNDVLPHIHPFESVYLSAEKLVMQDQRDEVVEFYARFGLGVDKGFKEPEDHIAAELSFISSLNTQMSGDLAGSASISVVAEKLEAQKEFMETHLLRWVHLMGEDLKKADENGFYGSMSDAMLGYIRIDYNFLKELVEYVKNEVQ